MLSRLIILAAMLTIRDEQMQAFVVARRSRFEANLTAHLVEQFKEELTNILGTYDEATTRAFVSQAIDCALGYGIDDEADIFSLVEIQAEVGVGFETKPGFEWASRILKNLDLRGNAKIELLLDGLSEGGN